MVDVVLRTPFCELLAEAWRIVAAEDCGITVEVEEVGEGGHHAGSGLACMRAWSSTPLAPVLLTMFFAFLTPLSANPFEREL